MDAQNSAVLIVGAIALASIINELIKVFFARMRSTDYVDKTSCEKCQNANHAYDINQGHKIDAMAKLMLAMAVKMGIDVKDIQGIM